jgi:hypothetical protein
MNLTNESIEEYLLLLADNELNEAEEKELLAFVEQHIAYKPMLEAYLATRLDNSESFIYPNKEGLLKPEPVVLPLQRSNIKPLKLAAAVAVLIGVGVAITLMFTRDVPVNQDKITASKNSVMSNTVVPPIKTTKDTAALLAQVSKQRNVTGINNNKRPKTVNSNTHNIVAYTTSSIRQKQQVPVQLANTSLNELSIDAAIQPQTIAMIMETPEQEIERKPLPEWLPVTEENLQGVNDLVTHIQALKESIQEKAQSLKNTAFVIRFGDRQISIGK